MKPHQLVVLEEKEWQSRGGPEFSLRVRWRRLGFLWFTDWYKVKHAGYEEWNRGVTDAIIQLISANGVLPVSEGIVRPIVEAWKSK